MVPKMSHSRSPASVSGGRRWSWLAPGLAVALTFVVRLGFILEVRRLPYATVSPLMVDAWYYHRWALEIVHGNFWGSEVFFLRPLYPYLLAMVYALFGPKVIAVQLVQVVMASVSCLLLYDISRRIFGRAAAAFAAFGFALTGILVFYTGTLLYVEVTILLSLIALELLLVAGNRWWRWLLAGVAFGLLVICRPELLILLPLFIIAAVPVRNLLVARDPVLFTGHSGINFYYGNNPQADGTWPEANVLIEPSVSSRAS